MTTVLHGNASAARNPAAVSTLDEIADLVAATLTRWQDDLSALDWPVAYRELMEASRQLANTPQQILADTRAVAERWTR